MDQAQPQPHPQPWYNVDFTLHIQAWGSPGEVAELLREFRRQCQEEGYLIITPEYTRCALIATDVS